MCTAPKNPRLLESFVIDTAILAGREFSLQCEEVCDSTAYR